MRFFDCFWRFLMDGLEGVDDSEVTEDREDKEVVDSPLDMEDIEAVADRGGMPRPPIVTS